MISAKVQWPRTVAIDKFPVEIRRMTRDDRNVVLDFARRLPAHDLLFLQRDIRNPKVVTAWIDQIEQGPIQSLLAIRADTLCGCAAVIQDTLSWSPHVAEIRVLITPDVRGGGLGRQLAQDALALAHGSAVEKVFVQMTPDQQAAMAVFEDLGFCLEALLRDHVRDADGATHDIAMLALNLVQQQARYAVFGVCDDV